MTESATDDGGADRRVPGYLGRVLDAAGQPVGTCFQVTSGSSTGLLVTAAHVVAAAGAAGVGDVVDVDGLPAGGAPAASAIVLRVDPARDLAVLRRAEPLPVSVSLMSPTDDLSIDGRVVVTGHVQIRAEHGADRRFLDAPGRWAGGTTSDESVRVGRLRSTDLMPGMSGAPVRLPGGGRGPDGGDVVVGVVRARYTTYDGWMEGSVWVARTEDLVPLLEGLGADLGTPAAGSMPRVWNLALRNAEFAGRQGLLQAMGRRLLSGSRVAVQALHGLAGVGKTSLAAEYAYRFAHDYDIVWWIDAEHTSQVPNQLAALAVAAGAASPDAPVPTAVEAIKADLRQRGRWLLVFDNAEDPVALRALLPEGPGHVVITSRNPGWSALADTVEIDVFSRDESVRYLRDRLPDLEAAKASLVAEELGDLPLALAAAAGVLAETKLGVDEYLTGLRAEVNEFLEAVEPVYDRSLAGAVQVSIHRVSNVEPAAAQLLAICAFLAPEPVPVEWFVAACAAGKVPLPEPLRTVSVNALLLRRCATHLQKYGLARMTQAGPLIHRMTALITRSGLRRPDHVATRAMAEGVVIAAAPGSTEDTTTWPSWNRLMPHLIHLDPANNVGDGEALRLLACDATLVQYYQGDYRAGRDFARGLYESWRLTQGLGPDHPNTLYAANNLARHLCNLGDYMAARELDVDILKRRRRRFGADHPFTLHSASNLARDLQRLGDHEGAIHLHQSTLASRRRLFGDDHPETLHSADRLAVSLHGVGKFEEALELLRDTLGRERRTNGENAPSTLRVRQNLATTLRAVGDLPLALALGRDVLDRRLVVLGADHPYTLETQHELALTLHALGELQRARELHEDTLTRRRRVFGHDHPYADQSEQHLRTTVQALGAVADREGPDAE